MNNIVVVLMQERLKKTMNKEPCKAIHTAQISLKIDLKKAKITWRKSVELFELLVL
jgi:hypothetical protein